MTKYKGDIKTIIEILTFGLIYLSISTLESPVLSYTFLGLWMAYLIYNLYSKFKYRLGKADYIRFPTQNDLFHKTTSIILGLTIIILSIIAIFWQKPFNYFGIIGITIGFLVFLNGLFDLPKGMIKVDANELSISGLKNKVDIRQLKEIQIYKEKLLLANIYNEIQRIDNLAIDQDSAKIICRYISENNTIDLTTKNNV